MMRDYPSHLINQFSGRNGFSSLIESENTMDDQPLQVSAKSKKIVDDMVANQSYKMISNVGRCFVAQQKYIEQMIDDGIEIEYPPQFKWDQEKVKSHDFALKLNNSNVGMMNDSFARLVKGKSQKSLREAEEDAKINEKKHSTQNVWFEKEL